MENSESEGLLKRITRLFKYTRQLVPTVWPELPETVPMGAEDSSKSLQQSLQDARRRASKATTTLPSGTEVESITFAPLREPHQQTIILLHGRGDTADQFSAFLLLTTVPEFQSLQEALPHARFVFLCAPPRPVAQLGNEISKHQWYDLWSLTRPEEKEELMKAGLHESVCWIHDVLQKESAEVGGLANVVLGGLSQGCATSLIAMLLAEGERGPAAFVGMCGWLPYQLRMSRALQGKQDDVSGQDSSLLAQNMETDTRQDYSQEDRLRAIQSIRDQLDLPPSSAYSYALAYQHTPFLMCHGL